MAPPAGQRLPEAVGVHGVDPHKGRGTWAAVEVFVAATHGKVGFGCGEVHRHGTRAVSEVPHGEDAFGVGRSGDGGDVVHGAGAVVHMCQHEHRHAGGERSRNLFGLDQHQFAAAFLAQRFGDVEIGGEVAAFAHDALAVWGVFGRDVERCREYLEEVDRCAVGGYHFAWLCTDQAGDLVAHLLRHLKPARLVPALDQVGAPFAGHHIGHSSGCGLGHHAQRIAVQVDHAGRQGKQIAQAAQRVLLIHGLAVGEGGGGGG